MTNSDDEMDELGKRLLSPLLATPPIDAQRQAEIKKAYLIQVEALTQAVTPVAGQDTTARPRLRNGIFGDSRFKNLYKAGLAVLVAIAIVLIGSSITVSAAQDSLPGQALYPVKSWSEDVSLALAVSPQRRLSLVLKYTNRRIDEISQLVSEGKTLDTGTSERFQQELDDALQLAAQLNDTQIQGALMQIKDHARNQGVIVQHLINNSSPQDEPAIHHIQDRLTEQVQISTFGEENPREFRLRMRELRMQQKDNQQPVTTDGPGSLLPGMTGTPMPDQNNGNHGNNKNKPSDVPETDVPGNGSHIQNPTHTPKP